MPMRNRRMLDLAHEMQTCTIRAPGCRGVVPGGLIPCHGNWQWLGKGVGLKADDVFAAGCHHCHDVIDGRSHPVLSRTEREELWMRGAIRTWSFLVSSHWLLVTTKPLTCDSVR